MSSDVAFDAFLVLLTEDKLNMVSWSDSMRSFLTKYVRIQL